jgi:nicotinate-nucleotide adenylyltransferase
MQKIGIMGGTFNPIHIGHMIAAQEVLYKMKLDSIIFMPTGNPPHKRQKDIISAEHRYEMVRLAIMGNRQFSISDLEIKREGRTYTYDTLNELHKIYYGNKLYFIIGFDTLKDLDSWRRIDDVCKMVSFIVVNRGNSTDEIMEESKIKRERYSADINIVDIPDIEISSTEIRRRVGNGENVRYLVHDEVEAYIKLKGLYVDAINEGL